MNKKILWNLFHESLEESVGNKALFDAIKTRDNLCVRNLYDIYPDFRIDVEAEQALLVEYDTIVFQHPFYWYSCPALMKQWQDKVLTYGFAYPPKEGKALHGKKWLSVITTGGPEWAYRSGGFNNFTMSELLRPFQQTAYLCGMGWLPPFVVHGILPGDYADPLSVEALHLKAATESLVQLVNSLDHQELHSLEPVAPLHYFRKITESGI